MTSTSSTTRTERKAKEVDVKTLESLEFPYGRSKILAEYKKHEYEYDDPIEARVFYKHFKPLAIAQQKDRQRPITVEVQSISRLRYKGNEYLTYQVLYRSEDWRHNPISFTPSSQGVYKVPRFRVDIDPNTNEVRPGTAQIESHQTFYDIPFTPEKAKELLDMFSEEMEPGPANLTVVDSGLGGRRFSCNVDEFVNMDYNEPVNLKTGFTEYMKDREGRSNKRK
jgi:hypothetical protein